MYIFNTDTLVLVRYIYILYSIFVVTYDNFGNSANIPTNHNNGIIQIMPR